MEVKTKSAILNRTMITIRSLLEDFGVKELSQETRDNLGKQLQKRANGLKLSDLLKSSLNQVREDQKGVNEWSLDINFDTPQLLKISISFPDNKSKVVDILKSVQIDVTNLGHPLILRAIRRYKQVSEMRLPRKEKVSLDKQNMGQLSSDQATFCLEEIAKIIKPSKAKLRKLYSPTGMLSANRLSVTYDLDFFEKVSVFLKSRSVVHSRTVSNKLMHIKIALQQAFPELRLEDSISWLSDRLHASKFPRRNTPNVLRNDYYAWKWGVRVGTAKSYFTAFNKENESFYFQSADKKIEESLDDTFFNILGHIEQPFYDDISSLVFEIK